MNLAALYLESARKRFLSYKELGDKTFSQISDHDFLFEPYKGSNSIAIIIKHMHGNMLSRFTNFLTEDGEKAWRKRDQEFEEPANWEPGAKELIALWDEGWNCFFNALDSLNPEDLIRTVTIRQEPLSVLDALNRQLAHYAYHVGQIVYLGKTIRGDDWKSLSIPRGGSPA